MLQRVRQEIKGGSRRPGSQGARAPGRARESGARAILKALGKARQRSNEQIAQSQSREQ